MRRISMRNRRSVRSIGATTKQFSIAGGLLCSRSAQPFLVGVNLHRKVLTEVSEPVHGHGLKLVISRVSEEMSEWQKELGLIRIGGQID